MNDRRLKLHWPLALVATMPRPTPTPDLLPRNELRRLVASMVD